MSWRRRYAVLHGLFDAGFRQQVRAAEGFVRGCAQGGLIAGDFNHVPDKSWRKSGSALGALDKRTLLICCTLQMFQQVR